MKILKSVEMANARAKDILAPKQHEIEILQGLIGDEAVKIQAAHDAMETATGKGDADGYRKAKAAKEDSLCELEMYRRRLDMLQSEPLMPDAEYKALVNTIMSDVDEIAAEKKERLFALAEEMRQIGLELDAVASEANATLRTLQRDVMKEPIAMIPLKVAVADVLNLAASPTESTAYLHEYGQLVRNAKLAEFKNMMRVRQVPMY